MHKTARIVEDNEDLALLLQTLARYENLNIVTTTREFDRLLTSPPWNDIEIAIVDIMLPGISGVEILKYLKEHHPEIMRIVYSAIVEQHPEAKELAHACFTKPNMPIQNLRWAIEDFFNGSP